MESNKDLCGNPRMTLEPYVDENKVWSKSEAKWVRDRVGVLRQCYVNQLKLGNLNYLNDMDLCDSLLVGLGATSNVVPTGKFMYKHFRAVIQGLHHVPVPIYDWVTE